MPISELVPIDPGILDQAGIIAYDDTLTLEERERRLDVLAQQRPDLVGSVEGYLEMLSMMRMGKERSTDSP